MALTTLIAALILGIVIGPLARLLVPGKQDINLIMTILIGAVGALTGSVVVSAMTSAQGFSLGHCWQASVSPCSWWCSTPP